jgi:hypothetical protein
MSRHLGWIVGLVTSACCFAPRAEPPPPPASAVAAAPGAPGADPCDGHWTGTGVQPGYPPWPIDMTVTDAVGDRCGTIEYPSLGCGGYLTGCAAMADGQWSFTEVYEHTTTQCAPAGSIHATCSGGTMTWTWEGEGGPSTTTLTRM